MPKRPQPDSGQAGAAEHVGKTNGGPGESNPPSTGSHGAAATYPTSSGPPHLDWTDYERN
jgi:hypothetical protein